MNSPAQRLFEYLLAIKNMTTPPKREIRQYEGHWYLDEQPIGDQIVVDREELDSDVFLIVHKQTILPAPEPDPILEPWILYHPKNDISELKLKASLLLDEEEKEDEEQAINLHEVIFEEDPTLVEARDSFIKSWQSWKDVNETKIKIQEFYSALFELWQRLDREGTALEVAAGHGVLLWDSPAGKIERPILVTRLSMEFDVDKGFFLFRLSDRGTRMETEMIAGIDVPNSAQIEELKRKIRDEGLAVFDDDERVTILREFATLLDANGTAADNETPFKTKEIPFLFDRTLLLLRKAGDELWKNELATAVEVIENNEIDLPMTIQSLFEEQSIQQDETTRTAWEGVGTDLYFPLPANEDQQEIAKRLSQNFGLTVQGPPGTGKSHTIANLISHLLAHGKRVLVTSQTEKALKVLKDKVPAEIQPLCVSVMSGDAKSVKEIQTSVDVISDKLSTEDPERIRKEVEDLKKDLHQSKTRVQELHMDLKNLAKKEREKIVWRGEELDPTNASRILADSVADRSWIKDNPKPGEQFPLPDDLVDEMQQLLKIVSSSDYKRFHLQLPPLVDLPNEVEFQSIVEEYNALDLEAPSWKQMVDNLISVYDINTVRQHQVMIQNFFSHAPVLEVPYLARIFEDIRAGGERERLWTELLAEAKATSQEIIQLGREIVEYEITLPDVPLDTLRTELAVLKNAYANGKPGFFFKMSKGRSLKHLTEYPAINGRKISTQDDVHLLITFAEVQDRKIRFSRKWNAAMSEIDGSTILPEEKRFAIRLSELAEQIEKAHEAANALNPIEKELKSKGIGCPAPLQLAGLQSILERLNVLSFELRYQELQQQFVSMKSMIEKARSQNAHPIILQFEEALEQLNSSIWKEARAESNRIFEANKSVARLTDLLKQLSDGAPLLAQVMSEHIGIGFDLPDDYLDAWDYRQIEVFLEELSHLDSAVIRNEIAEEERHSRRIIEKIVARSTWMAQLTRITESQRKSLSAWKQLIKKIGKGTGKLAEKHRAEARVEMQKCQNAIPVWIMPINRAIENFVLGGEKFDVVIVDESSQCDLFSLAVLLRAEKAVVVGDDQQISPSAVGADKTELIRLNEKYLKGIPRKSLFDMETSLFDLGEQIFPTGARLMLREHFRCVPEIIQFSNDLSYDGRIVPLRLPSAEERIEPPVLAIRVPGYRDDSRKVNEEEANRIVADMKSMLDDPTYESQTFGVISLLGNDQVKLIENKLRKEIGEEVMERRRILCGDAYAFQGDERDIIFLSLVVSQDKRFMALTSKEYQQRFNVAASRARNQMRLYHSVDLDDLKGEDMRAKLLSYCLEPKRVFKEEEDLEKLCDSPFEIEVLRMIQAKGYRVIPQVPVGGYRIDLVIEGLRNRLAVECDGEAYHDISRWEADQERQKMLERVGWTFWRVRGFDFYRNKEKAIESLWTTLNSMGIEPAKKEDILLTH